MLRVTLPLQARDLSSQMADMREWLDGHRFEPAGFSCRDNGTEVVVRVDFKMAEEAEAFARHFSRKIGEAEAAGASERAGVL